MNNREVIKKLSCCALISLMTATGMATQSFASDKQEVKTPDKLEKVQDMTIESIFTDKILASEIAKLLNKDINSNITIDELESIKELYISDLGIESLKGVEYLKNLNSIDANWNKISDLTPLSNLRELSVMWLIGNNISDVSPISNENLENLSNVWLNLNKIKNVDSLVKLPNVKRVRVRQNQIIDISAFNMDTIGRFIDIEANEQVIDLDDAIVGESFNMGSIKGDYGNVYIDIQNGKYENGNITWDNPGYNHIEFSTNNFSGVVTQYVLGKWKVGTLNEPVNYHQGSYISHNGKKYIVNITHKNYGDNNWAPGVAHNLFTEINYSIH